MKEQLDRVADSYDTAIDYGRKGIDLYKDLPEYIKNNPNYYLFEEMQKNNDFSDSGKEIVKEYLCPSSGMKLIDLGCSLNLMFRGYDTWPSLYHGVDISPKTIELLESYTAKHNISVGSLICTRMDKTPYTDNYFDIGVCIGSLEYYQKEYVEEALKEFNRIMKKDSRFVLDVPNIGSPECAITMLVEESLGRSDEFDMSILEFEELLNKYFYISKKEKAGPMLEYFLVTR